MIIRNEREAERFLDEAGFMVRDQRVINGGN